MTNDGVRVISVSICTSTISLLLLFFVYKANAGSFDTQSYRWKVEERFMYAHIIYIVYIQNDF